MGSKSKEKIIVGMSGGIDSSVAAALLVKQGHHVTGVTMKTWDDSSPAYWGGCFGPAQKDGVESARRVAAKLGIPFHVIDLSGEFKHQVLDFFCREYLAGRTPNPCVRCNKSIKFGVLWEKAQGCGIEADFFASGHYARMERGGAGGRHLLKKGGDEIKDQSYFLYGLTQAQLARTLFPLGGYMKQEVRKLCVDMDLGVETRKESQDFAGGDYAALFAGKAVPGPVVDKQGNLLGKHKGIVYYTRGQRKRLAIASKEPQYVIEVKADTNSVVVGGPEDLYTERQVVSDVNWIALESPRGTMPVTARIRSSHTGYAAVVEPREKGKALVTYKDVRVGAAPGQSIVFYDGDVVLGGGIAE
ncbi:MAG: tRNA 2-thiouridine(34) synthase MnmA [Chloroflexi bacterium]|nr:tRNA 2-thiouridine(34) synthase MnmA [Chloroflexota bacterium]